MRRSRRCRNTACAGCVWDSTWGRCRRGELDFLSLACSAARRLGDSAPCRPAGSPAQWQKRPRMRGCVKTRDRTAKPRWRWVRIGHAKRTPEFAEWELRFKQSYSQKNNRRRGVSSVGCVVTRTWDTPPLAAGYFFVNNFRSALFTCAKSRGCLCLIHTKPPPGWGWRPDRAISRTPASGASATGGMARFRGRFFGKIPCFRVELQPF